MNQKLDKIALASGEVLQKGQWIQLADKIALMFPEMKGNILPLKNRFFLHFDEFDFKYVKLQLDGEAISIAHKTLSLLEDEINYFEIDNQGKYCYTKCFKIELETAIETQEIIVGVDKERNTLKDYSRSLISNLENQIKHIKECFENYGLGLITENELDNQILDIFGRFFHRRNRWEVKDAFWGMMGGLASNFMNED